MVGRGHGSLHHKHVQAHVRVPPPTHTHMQTLYMGLGGHGGLPPHVMGMFLRFLQVCSKPELCKLEITGTARFGGKPAACWILKIILVQTDMQVFCFSPHIFFKAYLLSALAHKHLCCQSLALWGVIFSALKTACERWQQ